MSAEPTSGEAAGAGPRFSEAQAEPQITRFSRAQRIEHVLVMVLFVTLCLTGFPQKFYTHAWAAGLVHLKLLAKDPGERFSSASEVAEELHKLVQRKSGHLQADLTVPSAGLPLPAIAAGGALGGIFVAVIAPLIFVGYHELYLGAVLCPLLFLIACLRDRDMSKAGQWCRVAGAFGILVLSGLAVFAAGVFFSRLSGPGRRSWTCGV